MYLPQCVNQLLLLQRHPTKLLVLAEEWQKLYAAFSHIEAKALEPEPHWTYDIALPDNVSMASAEEEPKIQKIIVNCNAIWMYDFSCLTW